MGIEMFNDYIAPVIVVICLCVGFVVKKWIKDVDNKLIPTIVAILGVILAIAGNQDITEEIIATGLISGLASTGMYELLRQFIEKFSGNANDSNDDREDDEV